MGIIDDKNGIDFMMKVLDHQGVTASTVSDGHVIIFKRETLQAILDNNPDSKTLTIFVKRPEFND